MKKRAEEKAKESRKAKYISYEDLGLAVPRCNDA